MLKHLKLLRDKLFQQLRFINPTLSNCETEKPPCVSGYTIAKIITLMNRHSSQQTFGLVLVGKAHVQHNGGSDPFEL